MSDFFKTQAGTELPFLSLKGKRYLQVMHRLVWFREVHPEGQIKTQIVKLDLTEHYAIVCASIYNSDQVLVSQAHGREDRKDFPDYLEKAETKAIGRALAMYGFGTQFAPELDEHDRLADSPAPAPMTQAKNYHAARDIMSQNSRAPAPDTQGDFEIDFGKYRGKMISDVIAHNLEAAINYANWLTSDAQKKGKPLSQKARNFVSRVSSAATGDLYKQASPPAFRDEPPPLSDDDIPF